jgi:predicted Zn-dependent peptidase
MLAALVLAVAVGGGQLAVGSGPLPVTTANRQPLTAHSIWDVQRHRLANGLEVFITERRETKAVEVRAVVKVGHRYEAPLDSGLSHLLEHLLFKGTTRQTEAQLKWAVERRGGGRNGITTPETTYYYVNIRDVHFRFAVDWLEDIVFHSRLRENHLEQARKDVYSEQGGKYPRVLEKIFVAGLFQPPEVRAAEVSFPHAKVAERLASRLEHVDSATLRRHFESYYVPNNMAIIVVGNVDAATALREIEAKFGALKPRTIRRPSYVPYRAPRVAEEIRTRFYPPVGQMTDVRYGIWTRGHLDPDRHVLRMLTRHLDRRLKEEIRYKRALAYSVGCGFVEGLDVGSLYAYATGPRDQEDEVKAVMRDVIAEVTSRDISAADLADAREAYVGSATRYYESNSRLADLYQNFFMTVPFGGALPNDFASVERVTAAEIRAVAAKRLRAGALMFVVARPPFTYAGAAIFIGVLVLAIVAIFVIVRRRRAR